MNTVERNMDLIVDKLSVRAGGNLLVDDASFRLASGELVALLGPNGAGKTSLLRAALGLMTPVSGTVRLQGEMLSSLSPPERARRISYLPQQRPLVWPSPVRDIVSLGRFAWGCAPGRLAGEDIQAVDNALAACDLLDMAERPADTLSGGELARVHCARAFATGAPLLLVDEPVTSLDPRRRFQIMELIRNQVRAGVGAFVVLHDVSLAARYADRLIWMKNGRIAADGPPEKTLSEARLAEIYDMRCRVEGLRVEMEAPL